MNPLIIVAAISFFVGMFGYVLFVFWLRPVAGYSKVKRQLAKDLNAANTLVNSKPALKTGTANWKKHAAAVIRMYDERLPDWYKLTLDRRGESPTDAAKHLLSLANTQNPQHAAKRMAEIKACLKIK